MSDPTPPTMRRGPAPPEDRKPVPPRSPPAFDVEERPAFTPGEIPVKQVKWEPGQASEQRSRSEVKNNGETVEITFLVSTRMFRITHVDKPRTDVPRVTLVPVERCLSWEAA